jgi:hypothetical protein
MGCLRPWAMGPMALQLAHSEAITGAACGRRPPRQLSSYCGKRPVGRGSKNSRLEAVGFQNSGLSAVGIRALFAKLRPL